MTEGIKVSHLDNRGSALGVYTAFVDLSLGISDRWRVSS